MKNKYHIGYFKGISDIILLVEGLKECYSFNLSVNEYHCKNVIINNLNMGRQKLNNLFDKCGCNYYLGRGEPNSLFIFEPIENIKYIELLFKADKNETK